MVRWWWNLTLTGKLAVVGALALAGALAWWGVLRALEGGPSPQAAEPIVTPLLPSPSPVSTPPPRPTPQPTPTPAPIPTPSPTAPPGEVVQDVLILYTTCEGDGACGLMASGKRVHPGAAACNPQLMPFGTRFRIVGWPQELVCEDIHPHLSGYYVVVWFQTEAEGEEFRRHVGPRATIVIVSRP